MLYPTPTFFLFEQFPSFIFLLKPFIGDREKNNIHLRQDTLRCCKKKSQHKTTIDIRILLCAWGIIHLHSAKLCNRDVEKNCRNWFEDKQTKKCLCWAIIRFACQIRCLFLCSIQTRKCLKEIARVDIYTLHICSWNEISAVVEQQHHQNSSKLRILILQEIISLLNFLIKLAPI